MTVSTLYNSFTGGEIDPLLAARIDTPSYQQGALRMENAIPMATGGIRKRPGTWYVGKTIDNYPCFFIDWLLSDGTSLLVEVAVLPNTDRLYFRIRDDTDAVIAQIWRDWSLYGPVAIELAKIKYAIAKGIVVSQKKFVAVGGTRTAVSQNGTDWSAVSMPTGGVYNSIAYGNGKFVAMGRINNVAYSADGMTWAMIHPPWSTWPWESVTYGDGKFVAVGYNSDKSTYSLDGITWTETTLPLSANWRSVTYGAGKFVAVAYGTDKAAYSTNGISWVAATLPAVSDWFGVAYGNNKFVAVGDMDEAAYSFDGINWTAATLPTQTHWTSVAYGDGKFVAVSYGNLASPQAAYSTDGINWTRANMPAWRSWYSVSYGGGKFVALAHQSDRGAVSTGGVNWTEITLPSAEYWWAAAWQEEPQPLPNKTPRDWILFCNEGLQNMLFLGYYPDAEEKFQVEPFPLFGGPDRIKSVTFYGGRLCLGGAKASIGSDTRIMMSRVPDSLTGKYRYDDFTMGPLSGDAIVLDETDMAGSTIQWVAAGRRLLAGTERTTWQDNGAIPTPASFDMNIIEYIGSSPLAPKAYKGLLVYAGRNGKSLRALVWQGAAADAAASYADIELSMGAGHLFTSGIRDYAVMDYPVPTIWVVNGLGELISCTIQMDAGIAAFARHTLGGKDPFFHGRAESLEVARRRGEDVLYIVVARKVAVWNAGAGAYTYQEVRNIEKFSLEDLRGADYTESHYVDAGVRIEREEASATITGLTRFKNQFVQVFGDGSLFPPVLVDKDGAIRLSAPVKKAHIGLAIPTVLELGEAPLPANGTSFAKKRRIDRVIFNVYKTIGGAIELPEGNGDHVVTETFGSYRYGDNVKPYTGNVELEPNGIIDMYGTILITHDESTPFTLLGVVERIAIMEI